MANLTPQFSTNRVVREYTERYYLPAAAAYHGRAADKGTLAARLLAWQRHLAEHWHEARFGAVRMETRENEHGFTVELGLGRLDPDAVRLELYADPMDGSEPQRHTIAQGRTLEGWDVGHEYAASVPASRPAGHYTPRLVPHHPEAGTLLEASQILGQR